MKRCRTALGKVFEKENNLPPICLKIGQSEFFEKNDRVCYVCNENIRKIVKKLLITP